MAKHSYTTAYILSFLAVILLFSLLLSSTGTRNDAILGEWKEVEWKYEKAPQRDSKDLSKKEKNAITKNLVIHEAEEWQFLPNGDVILRKDGEDNKVMEWTLKGRGNILKLRQENNSEHYNLYKLSEDELVLYFHTDLQAKGIVKLKFQRLDTKQYAEKT